MQVLARAMVAALLLVALAGCGGPSKPVADPMPTVAAPPPSYPVTIVVTEEIPSGKPLQATVQAFPLLPSGSIGPAIAQGTDTQGAARFSFREPTTLLVRVLGPDAWTQEGAKVHIGSAVAAEGLTVSDRDVFVPLYRARIDLSVEHAWSTAVAEREADGSVTPARTVTNLDLPDGLELAYLTRLSDAAVQATWMDGTQGRATTMSAGLAWDGVPWVEGPEASALEVTGTRSAVWDGDLPADRPTDLGNAHLQAMLGTTQAVVGDLLVDIDASLTFGGLVPPGLPPAKCPGHLLVPC